MSPKLTKSATERQQARRDRMKAMGLVYFRAWIKPKHVVRIKKFIELMRKQDNFIQ